MTAMHELKVTPSEGGWVGSVMDVTNPQAWICLWAASSADRPTIVRMTCAQEVARIVRHAELRSTMTSHDDLIARPLAEFLRSEGIIDSQSYHLEWQGAWEHRLACYFWGDDHCLNVYLDGRVEVLA